MHYDPLKFQLARLLKCRLIRRLFHISIGLLFLRGWFVRRELSKIVKTQLKPQDNYKSTERSRTSRYKCLDAGMGFGQFSDWILRKFPHLQVVGLEIDRSHLYGSEGYFRQRFSNFNITIGDVQCLPFQNHSFDIIWAIDVMEHIPDDRAAFSEFARVLIKNGRLVLHTPRILPSTSHQFKTTKDNQNQTSTWSVGEHARNGYSDTEIIDKLTTAGLTVEKIVHSYGTAGRMAWTLLQRIPLSLLIKSKGLLAPIVGLYFLLAIWLGLLLMGIDYIYGDHKNGGGILVISIKNKNL